MKSLIAAAGLFALTTFAIPVEANAAVCARGVVRAGCIGPNGAVVARRPVVAPRYVAPRYVAPRAVMVRPVPVVRCTYAYGRRVCR